MQKVHCEWGLSGVELLREHAAVIVIVDVLSFSTAVDVAVHRKARIHPFPWGDDDAAREEARGWACAWRRAAGPGGNSAFRPPA